MKVQKINNSIIYNVTLSHPDDGISLHDFVVTDDHDISDNDYNNLLIEEIKNHFKYSHYHNIKIEYTIVFDNKIYNAVLYDNYL